MLVDFCVARPLVIEVRRPRFRTPYSSLNARRFRHRAETALLAVIGLALFAKASPSLQGHPFGPDFENVSSWERLHLDIRYATTNNFTGQNLYGDFKSCLLHRKAADKLRLAVTALQAEQPGYRFLVFDCLRPRRIQRQLWDRVAGTPQAPYVAHPATGSVHNFGFAIDLSLIDEHGRELDMGTAYDTFSPLSEPRREDEMLRSGRLTDAHLKNRRLLRRVMEKAGFLQLGNEWWHYDALPPSDVRKNGRIVE